jgi:hypothetical protein
VWRRGSARPTRALGEALDVAEPRGERERARDRAHEEEPEERLGEGARGRDDERHELARLHARRLERRGGGVGALEELDVGDPLLDAVVVEERDRARVAVELRLEVQRLDDRPEFHRGSFLWM